MTSFFLTAIGGNKTNDRQTEDYYATEPAAADLLIAAERGLSKNIWEPACGEGHLAKRFVERGYEVRASDLINRGYGYQFDFFKSFLEGYNHDIVTNPPYKDAERFVAHGCDLLMPGRLLCLFLKIQFLESVARDDLFDRYPPARIHVCRKRIKCAKNGDFLPKWRLPPTSAIYTPKLLKSSFYSWQSPLKREMQTVYLKKII